MSPAPCSHGSGDCISITPFRSLCLGLVSGWRITEPGNLDISPNSGKYLRKYCGMVAGGDSGQGLPPRMRRENELKYFRSCCARVLPGRHGRRLAGTRSPAGHDGAAVSHRVAGDRVDTGDAVQVAGGGAAVGHPGGPVDRPGDRPPVPGRADLLHGRAGDGVADAAGPARPAQPVVPAVGGPVHAVAGDAGDTVAAGICGADAGVG